MSSNKPKSKSRLGSASKNLADWSKLLAEQDAGSGALPAPGPTVKVRLGAWNVNLIGLADESEPGTVVDCPADLLVLHAELVTLFGVIQEKFGVLIKNAKARAGEDDID